MFRKLLVNVVIMLTFYFTGCAGRYGIPHHTAHQISRYQHLYTATAKSIEVNPILLSVFEHPKGAFIAGKVASLGVPKIERVGGKSEYGYYGSFHKYCVMTVSIRHQRETTEVSMGIQFLYPEPADHHLSVGDLIVVKISSQVPHRESIILRGDFVRNISQDWKTYKLPLTK